jgi:aryl-alcohol dehydrogenase-like predicted oxidoreductase
MSARDPMPTRTLGRNGPIVSRLTLGTMTFGHETGENEAVEQLDAFVAAGGTLVDTADAYNGGESERIVGRWLADRRPEQVLLTTKGRFVPPPGSHGASRRSLVRSVEGSLDRLGVDAIDLYLVHGWDQHTPVGETLDTLSALVRAGKIHNVGWSNVTGWQLQRIVDAARSGGFVEPCVLQPQYNLLDRGIELEVLPCCLEEGLAVTPWSPLGGGWLTGKYRRDARPTGPTRLGDDPERGVEAYDARNTDRTWRILDAVSGLARRLDRPMAQIAVAWLLTRPGVESVVLGARTVEQLAETLPALEVELAAGDLAELTAVSAPGVPPYPYGLLESACDVPHWRRLGTGPR